MILFILLLFFSYLVGSIPTAFLIGKWVKQIDIREHGSGNVGASNVFRVIGKQWGAVVLFVDLLKGFIPALLFWHLISIEKLNSVFPFTFSSITLSLVFGIAAIFGHNWPVWLRFKGGKGVATSLGVFLAILPLAALSAFVVFVFCVFVFNYIALGSIVASIAFVGFIFLYYSAIPEFGFLIALSSLLCGLIIVMHRTNISRLFKGTESPVFKRNRS